MKELEKARTRVIVVRPVRTSRISEWETLCGDCGPTSAKPYKTKAAAEKAATSHDKQLHGGGAVIRIRQR